MSDHIIFVAMSVTCHDCGSELAASGSQPTEEAARDKLDSLHPGMNCTTDYVLRMDVKAGVFTVLEEDET